MANIHLRPLMEKDAVNMYEWMTDPSIICFFRFNAADMSVEKCLNYIRDTASDDSCRHYAIADDNDEYLGTISLKDIDFTEKKAEYAISTRKCAHGTGAAAQATKEIFRIAFEEIGLECVYLNVLTENQRANGFYRKIGFKFDRLEKNSVTIRGEEKSLNWYSINKQEYLEKF